MRRDDHHQIRLVHLPIGVAEDLAENRKPAQAWQRSDRLPVVVAEQSGDEGRFAVTQVQRTDRGAADDGREGLSADVEIRTEPALLEFTPTAW
jgi:hypothetical protein